MDGNVLAAQVEKLKSLCSSKGLKLPDVSDIGSRVDLADYSLALLRISNKFEGVYALTQDIRARKFKQEFSSSWNPFRFEPSHGCKPFFTRAVENYGYDPVRGGCKCPDEHPPCTLTQSLSDRALWAEDIEHQMSEQGGDRPIESLKIVTGGLETIDIYGNSLEQDQEPVDERQKDQLCKGADVVLCSVQGFGPQSTEWSEWSGCSARCGPGTQERMKVNFDGTGYSLAKESRECELERCKAERGGPEVKCLLRNIPASNKSQIVNHCKCPSPEERLCTSEEAASSMRHWAPSFRSFCGDEIRRSPNSGILQKDIWDHRLEIMGRSTKIEFQDGFFYECPGNWGAKAPEEVHMYCKTGSPVLCTRDEKAAEVEFSALQVREDSKPAGALPLVVWACIFYVLLKFLARVLNRRRA